MAMMKPTHIQTRKAWQQWYHSNNLIIVAISTIVAVAFVDNFCHHGCTPIEAFRPVTTLSKSTTMKGRTIEWRLVNPPLSLSIKSKRRNHHFVLSSLSLPDNDDDEDNKQAINSNDEDEILQMMSLRRTGSNDSSTSNRPNKLELYGVDELSNLLDLHKQLYPSTVQGENVSKLDNIDSMRGSDRNPDDTVSSGFPGIHDLVLQNLEQLQAEGDDDEDEDTENDTFSSSDPPSLPTWLSESVKATMDNIVAIASDVDGTIIGSDQRVHPRTVHAIQRAVEASSDPNNKSLQWFFPATGKSRAGALNSLGPDLAAFLSNCPGVFVQGLYCVDGNGTVIFEKKLPTEAVIAAEALVSESGTSIIGYDGDVLFTTDLTSTVIELHEKYGEPLSLEIPAIAGHPNGVHKILFCDSDIEKLSRVRPRLEDLARIHGCVVTQAVPTMLELLPDGCSKAFGVQKLCDVLGIDPSTQLLALGDAENDVGMLEMAAIGVAVGNANDMAKKAADVILPLTSTDGGVGLAIEVIGRV
jgi:Cof subfamily protein (haloacid dehalogenase superfamily)